MRYRKLAGLLAGALTAAALVIPGMAAPATAAAPVSATRDLTCVFGQFSIPYTAELTANVEGTKVTGTLSKEFVPGMPAFVTISKMAVALNTTIDGAAVTLSGSDSYSPAKPGNGSFTMPALSGTRATGAPASALEITGAVLTMTAMGADNVVNCTAAPVVNPPAPVELTVTQDLNCTFGQYSIPYTADLKASVDGTKVTGALSKEFVPGMPAFVTVSKLAVALNTTINGAAVTLSGSESYSPAKPGNGSFAMPALSGERATGAPASALAVTGAVLTLTAMGAENVVNCVVPVDPGPSPACIAAQGELDKAKAAVVKATATVTKAKAAVKKAQAKVKKVAKSKAPKKKKQKQLKAAQKQLKAAKAQLTTATKQLTTAQQKVKTATNAVTAAC